MHLYNILGLLFYVCEVNEHKFGSVAKDAPNAKISQAIRLHFCIQKNHIYILSKNCKIALSKNSIAFARCTIFCALFPVQRKRLRCLIDFFQTYTKTQTLTKLPVLNYWCIFRTNSQTIPYVQKTCRCFF